MSQGTLAPSAGHTWIFDPIDGTVDFAHGLPIFCASLALEVDGRLEIGAVFDPNRQELFVAERGGGARLNGRPFSVTSTSTLIDAMLCTGFPYDVHDTADEVVGLFGAFVGRARAVRRLGSAALDLCYVAAGRFDGFWEQRLHPWDTAAGDADGRGGWWPRDRHARPAVRLSGGRRVGLQRSAPRRYGRRHSAVFRQPFTKPDGLIPACDSRFQTLRLVGGGGHWHRSCSFRE